MGRKTKKVVITSPEIEAKINPENKKIVERYLRNFDTKRSDKSVVVKRSDYNIFLCWNYLYNDNKCIADLKKYELMDFFDFGVNVLGWGTSRFHSMHSALSTLFNFMVNFLDEDYPNFINHINKIEKPVKQPIREKTILTDEQVESLIQHLRDIGEQQQVTYLLLCIGSGARISETLRFTTDIIDENNTAFGGHFLKTTKMIKTKGFGKTGAPKYKYIYKDLFWKDYQKWLIERQKILEKTGKNHNSIFIKTSGEPATVDKINYWTKKWSEYLTNDTKTNPNHKEVYFYVHACRHYLTTMLAKKGIGQELIVAIFGWKTADIKYYRCPYIGIYMKKYLSNCWKLLRDKRTTA